MSDLDFFTKEQKARAYSRTVDLIMCKAFQDILGEEKINRLVAEFTIDNNVYINPDLNEPLTDRLIGKISEKMRYYALRKLPIRKELLRVKDLENKVSIAEDKESINFLHYRRTSHITYTGFEGFYRYYIGPLLENTGELEAFGLKRYSDGFFIMLPDMDKPNVLQRLNVLPNIFEAYYDAYRTACLLGTKNLTDVNNDICFDHYTDMVLTCEAIFDSLLARAATEIATKCKKFVFMAGPSSSGKTSTANRLAFALRTTGTKPRIISLDDYYKDRTQMETGEKPIDIESIDALDLKQFYTDMNKLLDGEEIELPHFNFITTKREYIGNKIKLEDNDILIIEGIHSLNDKFTKALPQEVIYKLYVSALSHINIDDRNRIHSSDIRLIRRIVRDSRTRGYNALKSIAAWPDVRRGEHKSIFPYQGEADAVINTSMMYELAAIKPFAEKELFKVPKNCHEYIKARELLKYLDFVIPLSTTRIPSDSIIREFVGGSSLNVK